MIIGHKQLLTFMVAFVDQLLRCLSNPSNLGWPHPVCASQPLVATKPRPAPPLSQPLQVLYVLQSHISPSLSTPTSVKHSLATDASAIILYSRVLRKPKGLSPALRRASLIKEIIPAT